MKQIYLKFSSFVLLQFYISIVDSRREEYTQNYQTNKRDKEYTPSAWNSFKEWEPPGPRLTISQTRNLYDDESDTSSDRYREKEHRPKSRNGRRKRPPIDHQPHDEWSGPPHNYERYKEYDDEMRPYRDKNRDRDRAPGGYRLENPFNFLRAVPIKMQQFEMPSLPSLKNIRSKMPTWKSLRSRMPSFSGISKRMPSFKGLSKKMPSMKNLKNKIPTFRSFSMPEMPSWRPWNLPSFGLSDIDFPSMPSIFSSSSSNSRMELIEGDIAMSQNDAQRFMKDARKQFSRMRARNRSGGPRAEAEGEGSDTSMVALASSSAGTRYKSQRWPRKVVPFSFGHHFNAAQRATIFGAMKEISSKTCIKFRKRRWEKDYIEINGKNKCSSQIGRQGGKQGVSLSPKHNCLTHGTATHELIHAIGFWHEHSRSDRSQYVKVLFQNIQPGQEVQFMMKDPSKVLDLGVPYDFNSVMHYRDSAFARSPGLKTIVPLVGSPGHRISPSKRMTQYVAMKINRMYNCDDHAGNDIDDGFSFGGDFSKPAFGPPPVSGSSDIPGFEDWDAPHLHHENDIFKKK